MNINNLQNRVTKSPESRYAINFRKMVLTLRMESKVAGDILR